MKELIGKHIKVHRNETIEGMCRCIEIKLLIERVNGETCICSYVSSNTKDEDMFNKTYYINVNEAYAYFMHGF